MMLLRLITAFLMLSMFVLAADKPASSTEKNSKSTSSSSSAAASSASSSSASRNGEIIDQIAEESRISEVEAQEKSYANSGQPPAPQGPPPIPVPVPVQVRPGALVLPSPGRNSGGNQPNYDNSGYEYGGGPPSGYAKMQDSASAQSATYQSQPLTMQKQKDLPNQRGPPNSPPPPPSQSQGAQQQQQKQPQGPGPFQHIGSNMPSQGPKQPFPNQGQPLSAGQSKNHGQNLPPQLQGLPLAQMLPPQLPNPSQHRPNGPPFNQNPSGMLPPHPPGAILLPPQGPNFPHPLPPPPSQRNNPVREAQQKANINQDLLPQQSNPVPQLGELGVGVVPMGENFPGFPNGGGGGDEQWPQSNPEMPQILHLEAKCEKNLMKVAIKFDKPFFGVIFSKGNYDNEHCVYMRPGQGRTSATFDIAINGCGTTGNTQNGLYGYGEQSGSGSFFENTIIVQYDPLVQEVWDQARKLRCSWHDYYEKSVTFKPFNVEMLDIVHTDFAGDNVGCWMQIQVGKGPWANEVTGIVKIGQTMTMVLAIKDEENKFDMLVRDCVAHDGKRTPIELVDDRGCIVRSKLMSKFTKIKNFGTSASVMSYAHFQAFKFPDSMDVHFQCTIQICRYQCPEQCSQHIEGGPERGETMVSETLQQPAPYVQGGRPRLERAIFRLKRSTVDQGVGEAIPLAASAKSIGVDRNIKVVSTGDLAFNLDSNSNTTTMVYPMSNDSSGLICISTPSFTVTVVFLLAILVISCIVSTFLCLRHRSYSSAASSCGSSSTDSIYKSKPNFYQFLRKATY